MSDLSWRKAYTERKDGVVVSTVEPPCMAWYGKFETAIKIESSSWKIAEGYETLEEALEGHNKYANMSIDEIKKLKFIG